MRRTLLVIVILLARGTASAQAVSDSKLWLEGTGEIDLSDAAQLAVSASIRSGVESGFDQLRGAARLSYRVTDYLAFAGGYTLISRDGYGPLDTLDETRHRLSGDVNLRVRPGQFDLSYRLRLQFTTYEFEDDHFNVRNRVRAGYRATKRVTPYAALELIYVMAPKAEYRETRFYLGVDWRVKKRIELGFFFMRQEETNVRTPERNSVLGVDLTYTFKRAKNKNDDVSGADAD